MIAELFLISTLMCLVEARCPSPWCDPNYLPYPNMDLALHGYDISKADPFTSGVTRIGDPGWRSQIFLPTIYTDGKTHLPWSINVVGTSGSSTCSVDKVSTLKKYKELQRRLVELSYDDADARKFGFKELNNNLGFSVSLEGPDAPGYRTSIPAFEPDASSAGDSDAKIKEFFRLGGAMAIAQCHGSVDTIRVMTSYYDKSARYHPEFIHGVQQLWSGLNSDNIAGKTAALKEFTDKFGTHYSTKTVMGLGVIYQLRLAKAKIASIGHEDVLRCFDAKRLVTMGRPVDEQATASCPSSDETLGIQTERLSFFGPQPTETGLSWYMLPGWSTAALKSPVPVSMELELVLDLLSDEVLAKIFTGSGGSVPTRAAFLERIKPVWKDFGKILKQ